jgi:hypothetical protein
MKSLKIILSVLVGVIFGIAVSHLSVAKASPQDTGSVHVFIAPLEVLTAKDTRSQNLPGGRVVGISCIPRPTTNQPERATCYVATSLH